MKVDICPHCGFDLDGGDIFEKFLEHHKGDQAKAADSAEAYGWSKENPCHFSLRAGLYCMDKDCIVQESCPKCKGILPWEED